MATTAEELLELRRNLQEQTMATAGQDKRLAVVETEVHGLHKEITALRGEIKENTVTAQEAVGAVKELRATFKGGWWVMVFLQVTIAIVGGILAIGGIR